MHNNTLEPDSAVFARITDTVWKEKYDLEILATRQLSANKYLVVSVPHMTYEIQRLDVVIADPKTDVIRWVAKRDKNTSVRIVFLSDTKQDDKTRVLQKLVSLGYAVDPYGDTMLAADLDKENSRESVRFHMEKLLLDGLIKNWEYITTNE